MNYKVFIKSLYSHIKSLESYILNIREEINYFIYELNKTYIYNNKRLNIINKIILI